MLQHIARIAAMISATCIMAPPLIMLVFGIRKSAKMTFALLLVGIISGVVAVLLSPLSFIQVIELLALCAVILGIIWYATAPLGRILVDIWDEEDKLDAKLKGNHYERHD